VTRCRHWTSGRITLLGDAAHPMYPVGSNGAVAGHSRCAVSGRRAGARRASASGAAAYEQKRLPMTAEIVRANRRGGPEGVIDAVEQLAPDGFDNVDNVLSYAQREAIVRGYASKAGFAARAEPGGGAGVVSHRSPDGAQRNPGYHAKHFVGCPGLRCAPIRSTQQFSRARRRRQEVDVVFRRHRHHVLRLLLLHVVEPPEQIVEFFGSVIPRTALSRSGRTC
jgi:hypothetical protein